jgi:hypothetical protein
MVLDELAPWFNLVAHQKGKNVIGHDGILHIYS